MNLPRLLLLTFAVLLLGAPAASAAALYPDMRTLPPRDMRFDVTDTDQGRQNVLRFTNTVWNAGEGPVEIGGTVPQGATSAAAIQKVKNDDGTSQTFGVGSYTIHVQHQHFHYDHWGRYELWTKRAYDAWLAAGRPASTQPDKVGTKTTSCVLDEEFIASIPRTPYPRVYPDAGCDATTGKIESGLSVGWGDTYDYYRYDQWIPLGTSKLSDGDYVLRSVADPDNKIYESPNKADAAREGQAVNEGIVNLRIVGGQIVDQDRPTGTVTINDVDPRTSTTNVTVRVLGRDDVSGVGQVRVSNDGVTWRQYAYGGSGSVPMTIAWDLADTRYGGSTTGGVRTVYAQYQDNTGKWSSSETDTIDYTAGTGGGTGGSNSLYATAVLGDSPLSYWRLGETTGTVAKDERGMHQGTYNGAPAIGQPSLLNSDTNKSVRFSGTQHVAAAGSSAMTMSGAFSLEAWIKPTSIPAAGSFASIMTKPEAYSLQFNGPRLEFTVIQNGVRKRLQAPAGAVVAGQTYHVVGTYEGKEQRLYINGQLVATTALTGVASAGWGGLFMASWDGGQEFFQGTLDEIAIYNTMLTGLQAKQHYDAGVSTAVGVATPSGLTATAASGTQIDLRWTDNANNETGFVVERSTSSAFTSPTRIPITTPDTLAYSDKGLTPGTTYFYRVQAVTQTDSSSWSNTASSATNTEAVASPSALGATPASSSRIDLRWTDNATNETGFILERSTSSTFATPTAVQLPAGTATYADTGRAAATTYWYRVKAVSDNAESAWSNTSSATTLSDTPAPTGYAGTVAADGPVSHWRLGEASGTAAADARGINAGTYLNAPTLGAVSLLQGDTANKAVRFNGTSQSMRVADNASIDFTNAFTLEAWIKPEVLPSTGGWASIATKAEAYSLQFNGPRLEFTLMQSGTRQRLQAPVGAVVAGQAYHVVATFDGITQRLYLNGTQVASRAQAGSATTTSTPLYLATWDGGSEWMRGTIDDVAVYGKVLTAARVSAHHSAGSTAQTTTASATRTAASADTARSTASEEPAAGTTGTAGDAAPQQTSPSAADRETVPGTTQAKPKKARKAKTCVKPKPKKGAAKAKARCAPAKKAKRKSGSRAAR